MPSKNKIQKQSSKTKTQKPAAKKSSGKPAVAAKPAAYVPREYIVNMGDAFRVGISTIVVVGIEQGRAVCRGENGRTVRVQVTRLQREYARCGTIATAAAHRTLARIDAAKAKPKAKTKRAP